MSVLNAKLNFSFLCDYASVSREGKLNLNGIFEDINVRSFPAHHPVMFMAANISGVNSGDNFTCELVLDEGDKKRLAVITQRIKVDPNKKFGFLGQFVNVRYECAGSYALKFYVDNKEIGSHGFQVREIKT